MAGLRLGGQSPINGANTLTYYAGGHAVKEFEGDDGLLFTSGTSSIRIANDPQDTFGRFELGVNIATPGGVTGFIEGNADIGGDCRVMAAVRLRIRFLVQYPEQQRWLPPTKDHAPWLRGDAESHGSLLFRTGSEHLPPPGVPRVQRRRLIQRKSVGLTLSNVNKQKEKYLPAAT